MNHLTNTVGPEQEITPDLRDFILGKRHSGFQGRTHTHTHPLEYDVVKQNSRQ